MTRQRLYLHWMLFWMVALGACLPWSAVQAAPAAQEAPAPLAPSAAPTVVFLDPTDDARTQTGSPNTTFDDGFLWMGHPNVHFSLLKFDLSVLPPDATINAAGVRLDFLGVYTGTNDIEAGRVEGAWTEATLTASTPVTYTWSGQFNTVTSTGIDDSSLVTWNVTSLVQAWHSGAIANDGLALRGNGGILKAAHSKETGAAGDRGPKLIIAYTLPAPDGQPRPDLGDAPDSTNHHGLNNTAYLAGPVLGQFPTVWDVPAGQPAGPRHLNQAMEGWLGDFLSREAEADQGPDQDAPRNNILRNTVTGAVGDVADNDRADDGWRNRTVKFFDCQRQTLDIRISKAPAATRNTLYLNVWFDGNRDGDWADLGQCQPDEEEPAQASYEWIVQNYIVDMTSIPAGGALDFAVLTEKVMNASPGLPHWMRFMLSEEPAVQPAAGGLPDGRGPHPTSPLGSYRFGETEDVLQRPAPAGTVGTLQILKNVITDGEPVEWIDYVTYEIRLRHAGGTEPMQARLRDVLPYPLIVYPTVTGNGIEYVQVASPTGGATPLQAQLDTIPPSGGAPPQQVVRWQGTLAPNAEVKFTFQVRVLALCQPNQQTMTFTNTAQARPKDGAVVSAADTFTARCIDYDESAVEFTAQPFTPTVELDAVNSLPWSGTVRNRQPYTVTVGIYQQAVAGAAGTVNGAEAGAGQARSATAPLLSQLTLGPNETRSLVADWRPTVPWAGGDELSLPDDPAVDLGVNFCLIPAGLDGCPDRQLYPTLHGHIPYTLTLRPNDLGDAPDSTNHTAGAAGDMPAYPGVLAQFPTVFDPATGQPQGPRHSFPGPLHLGQFVSREAEADLGPDQDPLNNLRPAADDPDNDRGDDGPVFATWAFANCQQTVLQTRIAVAQSSVNYFQNLGAQAYLNVWIDANRDGDWADAGMCGQQAAPEHILIDSPVNVVALGAGLHTIFSQTGLVPWPAGNQPAWVRVTLSDRPSNKTLQAGNVIHGDGRGFAQPFKTGETEDFLFRSKAAGGGPDLDVQLVGSSWETADLALLAATAAQIDGAGKYANQEVSYFKIDYSNRGTSEAPASLLEFQIPEHFHGVMPTIIRGAHANQESISFNFDKLSLRLPPLAPNTGGAVVLGWYGCITCTRTSLASAPVVPVATAATADYNATVTLTAPGDVDASNNQASASARSLLRAPVVGAFMDYTDDACMDRVLYGPVATNKSTVQLRGQAAPNSIIAILIGLQAVGTATSDANGNFSYAATLPAGLHRIGAEYAGQVGASTAEVGAINSPRDVASGLPTGQVVIKVDPTLPFDPMSACFVDSQGRSYAMPTLGYSFGATQTGSFVRSGATYAISVNAGAGDLNRYYKITFEDVLLSSLTDPDRDGTYKGTATFPATAGASSSAAAGTGAAGTGAANYVSGRVSLVAGSAAGERSYSTVLGGPLAGVVGDRATGQPLAGASVSALPAQAALDGSLFFSGWSLPTGGDANPQLTSTDGSFSFSITPGLYRLGVTAAGYQPYRSPDVEAGAGAAARTIALSPVIAAAPAKTIYITANGYLPAAATVPPGSVVEFVNLDLVDHSTTGATWDSGLLAPGQGYKVSLPAAGVYSFGDAANPLHQGTLTAGVATLSERWLYLPAISR